MKHIKAILPSLIATALSGPAVCQQPTETAPTRQTCRSGGHQADGALSARDLLADGALVERVRQGLAMVGGVRADEAEEAAQEAALRALDREVTVCSREGMQRWLLRTGRNYLFDLRRKKREQLLDPVGTEGADPIALMPAFGGDPTAVPELRDQLSATAGQHDVARMKPDKRAWLGQALGERVQEGFRRPGYLPKAEELALGWSSALRALVSADEPAAGG